MSTIADADVRRFLSKVSPCPITGCWWWSAGVDKDGYGKFQTGPNGGQKHWRAHRFALLMVGTDVDNDLVTLHACDQPLCVNPAHLRLGTQTENRADCTRKGRNATGERNGANTHRERMPRGDRWYELHPGVRRRVS
jgi:hypothetical protein